MRDRPLGRSSERDEQVAFIEWARLLSGAYPALELLHAIPNTNAHHRVSEGVLAGIPDLHLPVASGGYHSLYIEMKRGGGRLSKAQKRVRAALEAYGNRVAVCWSCDEAIAVACDYLGIKEEQL